MNLPNKLTMARMIAVPFFIAFFLLGNYPVALVLFIAASATDYLDGHIARSRNLVTNFGKIMDPLADKILVYSALCLFIETGIQLFCAHRSYMEFAFSTFPFSRTVSSQQSMKARLLYWFPEIT